MLCQDKNYPYIPLTELTPDRINDNLIMVKTKYINLTNSQGYLFFYENDWVLKQLGLCLKKRIQSVLGVKFFLFQFPVLLELHFARGFYSIL